MPSLTKAPGQHEVSVRMGAYPSPEARRTALAASTVAINSTQRYVPALRAPPRDPSIG
jgi:hypothetical protein